MATQVKIRVEKHLHYCLKKRAAKNKRTLNGEIIERLKESFKVERELTLIRIHLSALEVLLELNQKDELNAKYFDKR